MATKSPHITASEAKEYFVYRMVSGSIPDTLQRIELPIGKLDLLQWLNSQPHSDRIYWSSRDEKVEVAAVGRANAITGEGPVDYKALHQKLTNRLLGAPGNARFYGGIRFDEGATPVSPEWAPFGSYTFVLPRIEIVQTPEKTTLVCHVVPEDQNRLEDAISSVMAVRFGSSEAAVWRLPKVNNRSEAPPRSTWLKAVSEVVGDRKVDKLVLAREVLLDLSEPLNPLALVRAWKEKVPGCYHIAFCLGRSNAFVSCSPEVLYQRRKQLVRTEAVAGTRPAGNNEQERNQFGRALLNSRKDRFEHQFVTDHIQRVLMQACTKFNGGQEVGLLQRRQWQHLYQQFEGVLKPEIVDFQMVKALHPTPAVGGVPKKGAAEKIRKFEGIDRGWYAGPIGWISNDSAEFAVGIRSALVTDRKIRLYAGAGIVEGSQPEEEWAETELKLSQTVQLLKGSR